MADELFSKAFIQHLEKMAEERKAELRPLEDGSSKAGRGVGGVWTDITDIRIAQIKREIEALENAIVKYGKDHA